VKASEFIVNVDVLLVSFWYFSSGINVILGFLKIT